MKLSELLQGIPVLDSNLKSDPEITGVSYDSRTTKPGELFVAVSGFAADGHRFIPMAQEKGAACVLCEHAPAQGAYIRTEDTRAALAVLGANWFGHPARQMQVIGVTGTNGKTTVTLLLKTVLEQTLGAKVGLIGTISNLIGDEALPTERTTPESFELQRLFRQMADAGCTHVVMEVSSHALTLHRVDCIPFAVGAFTNLTEDHLDFHKTMEAYCDAKALLFRKCEAGVVNADDAWLPRLTQNATCRLLRYSAQGARAQVWAENVELESEWVAFDACTATERVPVRLGIPGGFSVYNALTVIGMALALEIPLQQTAAALANAKSVKGRVEVVPTPETPYSVLIDYAHTPDALENVLRTVQGFCKGRTILVFGCGGDRDPIKRPIMGRAAVDGADFVVVTSDNPRTEDPEAIICQILAGMEGTKTPYHVEPDRRRAIRWAMDHAQKDDIIILAGKGHEDYQILGTTKVHLDEREEVAAHLREIGGGVC